MSEFLPAFKEFTDQAQILRTTFYPIDRDIPNAGLDNNTATTFITWWKEKKGEAGDWEKEAIDLKTERTSKHLDRAPVYGPEISLETAEKAERHRAKNKRKRIHYHVNTGRMLTEYFTLLEKGRQEEEMVRKEQRRMGEAEGRKEAQIMAVADEKVGDLMWFD